MKNTLFDLWNVNLCPIKEIGKNTIEISEMENLIDSNCTRITDTLNDKQKEFFERYVSCINEYIGYTNEESFYYGFGLAVKIFLEVL